MRLSLSLWFPACRIGFIAGSMLLPLAALHAQSDYAIPCTFTTLAGIAGSPGSADGSLNSAQFNGPTGIAQDGAGNIFVADTGNHTIRKIAPTGTVTTLAGIAGSSGSTDGTGSAARFNSPTGVAVDTAGNVYVADRGNRTIRKITSAGVVTTLAGDPNFQGFSEWDGTGSGATFYDPRSVTVDRSGNTYVADTFAFTIRKINPAGVVTTPAGLWRGTIRGGPPIDAQGSAAQFTFPAGLAIDGSGNVVVADREMIRKITPAGAVTTLADLGGYTDLLGNKIYGNSPSPTQRGGIAVDMAGNTFATNGEAINLITPTGAVSVFAGLTGSSGLNDGTGSSTRFNLPLGIALDGLGSILVADSGNHTIRKGVIISGLTIAPPVSQTMAAGQTTAFAVAFSGTPAPSGYQWQRLAVGSDTWVDLSEGGNYTGTQAYTLLVSNANLAMNGDRFRCVITNSVGPTVSAPATLSVLIPPTWARGVLLMNRTAVASEVALDNIAPVWRMAATGDFNGDGKTDVIWQNGITGQHLVALMDGTHQNGMVDLGTTDPTWQMAGTGDFNGDGQPDILWQNIASGQHSIWLMNGTNNIGNIELGTTDPVWRMTSTGDFNGDGQTDILWQNIVSGQHSIWLMNGTINIGNFELPTTDPIWRVAGTGDFNNDGRIDILWQNLSSGLMSLWLMDGTTYLKGVDFGAADPNWQAAGVGDFNGDGQPDVLRQKKVFVRNDLNGDGYTDILWTRIGFGSGGLSIWFMNNTNYLSQAYVTGGDDANWRFAGTGDFNGDGQVDIIWHNLVTGQNSLWLMWRGLTYLGGVELESTEPAWQIAGVNDFNGDGQTDLLMENTVTGQHNIWLMNGTTHTGTVDLPTTSPAWQIVGTGDFNDDSQADILWQNTNTGQHSIWLMMGTTNTGSTDLGTTDPNWQMAGTGDFNGDGKTDVLWQNLVTGQHSIWLMLGTENVGTIELGTTNPYYQIVN